MFNKNKIIKLEKEKQLLEDKLGWKDQEIEKFKKNYFTSDIIEKSSRWYNTQGKCICETNNDGEDIYTGKYDYDNNGNCLSEQSWLNNEPPDSKTINKYDKYGNIVEEYEIRTEYPNITTTFENFYNDKNLLLKQIWQNRLEDGRPYGEGDGSTKFEYNTQGKCIKKIYSGGIIIENHYDSRGNCTLIKHSYNGGIYKKFITLHDEQNLPIVEIFEDRILDDSPKITIIKVKNNTGTPPNCPE